MKDELVSRQPEILRLKTVRDKQVAHENLNHPNEYDYNTYENLANLIEMSERFLNKISVRFYGNTGLNSNYKAQVINDTRSLLRHISN